VMHYYCRCCFKWRRQKKKFDYEYIQKQEIYKSCMDVIYDRLDIYNMVKESQELKIMTGLLFKQRHRLLMPLVNLNLMKMRRDKRDRKIIAWEKGEIGDEEANAIDSDDESGFENLDGKDPSKVNNRRDKLKKEKYNVDQALEDLVADNQDSELEKLVDLYF